MLIEKNLYNDFVNDFSSIMCQVADGRQYSNIIFLCIGTDRITGDSFGPLVGYKLNNAFYNADKINIIGDLSSTVCSNNAREVVNYINETYSNPLIIAIDAALSCKDNIGKIVVREGGLYLGKGLNKSCIYIGDMCIKGIVGQNLNNPMNNLRILQNTPLGRVMQLADVVSKGIYNVINYKCDE